MHDSDGPIIAKKVYQALFETTNNPRHQAYSEIASQRKRSVDDNKSSNPPLLTLDAELASLRVLSLIPTYSLAETVDDIVRHLRLVEKVPADQWATFVHVGV